MYVREYGIIRISSTTTVQLLCLWFAVPAMQPTGSKHAEDIAGLPFGERHYHQVSQLLGVQQAYSKPQCNKGLQRAALAQ